MKKISVLLNMFYAIFITAQVGIGTEDVNPNIILQVEAKPNNSTYTGGIMFPRIALTATNIFAPITGTPVTGLIIYNTSTARSGNYTVIPGLYFWDNSNLIWERTSQKQANESALFANEDVTTDINAGDGIYAELFANIRFNNNPSLYEKVNNSTLKINEVGYYKVILNLDLASSGGADNFGIEIVINNTDNIVSDNIYIPGRWDSETGVESNFPNGKSFVIYIPINVPGHTLRIRTYELDPGTDVRFKNRNTSTISIEKIR